MAIKREKREKHEKADKKEKPVKTKSVHRKSNWILYIAVVALVLYIAVTIVDQNVKIREARQELSELNQQINLKIIELDEKKKVADAAEKNDFDSSCNSIICILCGTIYIMYNIICILYGSAFW